MPKREKGMVRNSTNSIAHFEETCLKDYCLCIHVVVGSNVPLKMLKFSQKKIELFWIDDTFATIWS